MKYSPLIVVLIIANLSLVLANSSYDILKYHSSNGSKEICVTEVPTDFKHCLENISPKLCYTFSEAIPADLSNTPLKLRWRMGNSYIAWGEVVRFCYPTAGKYEIHLDYIDTLTGIEYTNVGIYNLDIQPINTLYLISLDSIKQNTTLSISYKNTISSMKKESPIWSVDDFTIGHEKLMTHQFKEVGKHHLILSGVSNYSQNDSATCTFKDIVVMANKDSLKQQQKVDLIFPETEENLSEVQIEALNTLIDSTDIRNSDIYIRETEYSCSKNNKKIEQSLEDFFMKKGFSKSKLHYYHNLKMSSPPTKYTPKRITVSFKNH